jgi:hypothetical protein
VYGHAKVEWSENGSDSTTWYNSKEIYLDSKTFLFRPQGENDLRLEAGKHRVDFSCRLPEPLPGSLKLKHGKIEYFVKAVLDVPWGINENCCVPFVIVRDDDLNNFPALQVPQRFEIVKKFHYLFKDSQLLKMTISIPSTGFSRGQPIPIRIEYSNNSKTEVEETRFELHRVITFITSDNKRVDKKLIAFKTSPGVGAHLSSTVTCNFGLPFDLHNSNSSFCKVINVEYFLIITAAVGLFHSNPSIKIPITIASARARHENPPETLIKVPAQQSET